MAKKTKNKKGWRTVKKEKVRSLFMYYDKNDKQVYGYYDDEAKKLVPVTKKEYEAYKAEQDRKWEEAQKKALSAPHPSQSFKDDDKDYFAKKQSWRDEWDYDDDLSGYGNYYGGAGYRRSYSYNWDSTAAFRDVRGRAVAAFPGLSKVLYTLDPKIRMKTELPYGCLTVTEDYTAYYSIMGCEDSPDLAPLVLLLDTTKVVLDHAKRSRALARRLAMYQGSMLHDIQKAPLQMLINMVSHRMAFSGLEKEACPPSEEFAKGHEQAMEVLRQTSRHVSAFIDKLRERLSEEESAALESPYSGSFEEQIEYLLHAAELPLHPGYSEEEQQQLDELMARENAENYEDVYRIEFRSAHPDIIQECVYAAVKLLYPEDFTTDSDGNESMNDGSKAAEAMNGFIQLMGSSVSDGFRREFEQTRQEAQGQEGDGKGRGQGLGQKQAWKLKEEWTKEGRMGKDGLGALLEESVKARLRNSERSVAGRVIRQKIMSCARVAGRGYARQQYNNRNRRQHAINEASGIQAVLPQWKDVVPELVVVCDTSGSMSRTDIEFMLGELVALAREYRAADRIHIFPADTSITQYHAIRNAEDIVRMPINGGGGTNMPQALEGAMQYLKTNVGSKPNVALIITDGDTPWGGIDDIDIPVIVALTGNTSTPTPKGLDVVRIYPEGYTG